MILLTETGWFKSCRHTSYFILQEDNMIGNTYTHIYIDIYLYISIYI